MYINVVEVQGIWDEKDEALKEVVAIWGILPKVVTELKKRVLEDNVANITRSGKHYKPSFLEKDHPSRDLGEGSKTIEPKGKEDEKEEEDRILAIEEDPTLCVHMGLTHGLSKAS